MFEGQSQRSVTLSAQHRQEAEVAAAEERERAAARAARLAMAELAAVRVEVEAAAAADAACAVAAELEALRTSSTDNSVSADDDRDKKLKLAREAQREQAAQWAATHPQGRRGGSPDGRGRAGGAPGGRGGGVPLTKAATQTGADAPAAGLTEIAAFIGSAALPPRTGTMVIMGSKPLSGTSVLAAGGLPSPRPTTSSGPQ
jgi:hypothetical protein